MHGSSTTEDDGGAFSEAGLGEFGDAIDIHLAPLYSDRFDRRVRRIQAVPARATIFDQFLGYKSIKSYSFMSSALYKR